MPSSSRKKSRPIQKSMFRFVIIIGIANFFADATYEGARSIIGPFLGSLGATATIIGIVAGLGELIGFALRAMTGLFADRSHQYWWFAFIGYAINVLAVPALALAGHWPLAATLIIIERTGRAIRKPAVDAMLSFTTKEIGHGYVFGLNEALDQAGATLGPLIVSWVLYLKGDYRNAFGVLLISAVLCLLTIAFAWYTYRVPHRFEKVKQGKVIQKFGKAYWLYVIGGVCIAAGFADFALISFHFDKQQIMVIDVVPLFYSLAMATAAIFSLIFGRLLDKYGFPIFLFAFFISAFFAPFAFSYSLPFIVIGTVLWGIGLGSQDALIKAQLSKVISHHKRGTGFGLFDSLFGVGWFIGSAIMGWLYSRSITLLIIFSMVTMLAAMPIFIFANQAKE